MYIPLKVVRVGQLEEVRSLSRVAEFEDVLSGDSVSLFGPERGLGLK